MKRDSLIYVIGTIVVVLATIMKISHAPGAEYAWPIALVSIGVVTIYLGVQNMKMKKRLKELKK